MSTSVLETISNEFAAAAEAVGPSVVAIYARRWMPASGLIWKPGVIVTADHNLRREEDILIVGHQGKVAKATLAGRDPSTDLAILKFDDTGIFPPAPIAPEADLKLGNLVLALGRSRSANVVASFGMVGAVSGEWRTWRGGRLEQQSLPGRLRRAAGQHTRQGRGHQHTRPWPWPPRDNSARNCHTRGR